MSPTQPTIGLEPGEDQEVTVAISAAKVALYAAFSAHARNDRDPIHQRQDRRLLLRGTSLVFLGAAPLDDPPVGETSNR